MASALFIFIISGAIIASIEKTIDFKQLIPPDRIGLIYVALIALAVCLFIAGLKKSWAAWVILAVLLTIALHITFLSAGLSITMVIFLLLLAFPNLATSAPKTPAPGSSPSPASPSSSGPSSRPANGYSPAPSSSPSPTGD